MSDGSYESMDELDCSELLNVVSKDKTSPYSEMFRKAYKAFFDSTINKPDS